MSEQNPNEALNFQEDMGGNDMSIADMESKKPVSRQEIAISLNLDPNASWQTIKAKIDQIMVEAGEKTLNADGAENPKEFLN